MTRDVDMNPIEDADRLAKENAKAPLGERPVSHPGRPVAQEAPKTLRKTDADA